MTINKALVSSQQFKLYKAGVDGSGEAAVWSEESNDYQMLRNKLDERKGGEFLIARIVKGAEYVNVAKDWAEPTFRVGVLVDPDKLRQRTQAAATLGKIKYRLSGESVPKLESETDYEQVAPKKQPKLKGEVQKSAEGVTLNTDGTPRKQKEPPKTNEQGEVLNKDGSVRKRLGRRPKDPNQPPKKVLTPAKSDKLHFRVYLAKYDDQGVLTLFHQEYEDKDVAKRLAAQNKDAFVVVCYYPHNETMLVRKTLNWAKGSYQYDQRITMEQIHKLASKLKERTEKPQEDVKEVTGFLTPIEAFKRAGTIKEVPSDKQIETFILDSFSDTKMTEKKEEPDIQDIMDAIDAQAAAYRQVEKISDVPLVLKVEADAPDITETVYQNIVENQREAARRMNTFIKANLELDAVGHEIIERNKEIFELESRLAMLKDSNKLARDRSDELRKQADENARSIAQLLGGHES